MLIGLIGIILSLILLIFLAYRGVSVVVAAPICAMVALLFSGAPLLPSYTEIFMPALGRFISNYFPMFLTGAIFGALMSASGFAKDIAQTVTRLLGPKRAILATVLTSAILTYGGISVFVVVFVMFPLALELFKAADIPRRLIPATIGLGILTFTLTALPGTPQVQNIIPGTVFQTDTFAAPGVGILATVIILGLGMFWLEYRRKQLAQSGEHFADLTMQERRTTTVDQKGTNSGTGTTTTNHGGGTRALDAPDKLFGAPAGSTAIKTSVPGTVTATLTPSNHVVPFVPLLVVFAVNFGCSLFLFPLLNWDILTDEKFGGVTLAARSGIWAVLIALVVAILSIMALNIGHVRQLWSTLIEGSRNALTPIFSTASEVGYGAVIASVAAFAVVRDGILGVSDNALVATAVSTSTIAGITGSASGGMTIALNALGEDLRTMAIDQGISMEAMHRVTALASGGLDSLPHNGAIITLILVCGMTHKESYKDIGVISILVPITAIAIVIPAIMIFGTF
jgi:H+/gluconate symporter-like permease